MSEFDPRWSAGRPENPGQQDDQQGEPGGQDKSGSQQQPAYPGFYGAGPHGGYPGYGQQPGPFGAEYSSGHGLGDPSRGWTGYTYPGAPGQPGGPAGTAQFGQPGWPQHGGEWGQPLYPPYQQPQRRRPLRTAGIAVGAIALSVLIGLGIGRIAWPSNTSSSAAGGNQNFGSVPAPNSSGGGTSNTSINVGAIAAKVDPGLVDIDTVLGYQSAQAAGTGIVLTSNGEILTNNHVVEGATSIRVTDIGNGQTYNATVVGYDRSHDIAVLQLQNASGLTTETLGDSTKTAVGDAVVGIGNAGGAGGTPSAAAGTVTALNQSITASDGSNGSSEKLSGLIQTDANIQSGDSGGSLVNSAGQVIGVDTAASSGYQFTNPYGQGGQGGGGSSGSTGGHQGYAIPINSAITIAHQIIGNQASSTVHIGQSAFIGVQVSDSGQGASGPGGLGNPNGGSGGQPTTPSNGATIVGLIPSGPAQQGGLQTGDVITSVNGTNVTSATALTNLMDTFHPGDKLTITYTDPTGQQQTATVTPVAGPVG
jgi:S1-C subfamily serine protease